MPAAFDGDDTNVEFLEILDFEEILDDGGQEPEQSELQDEPVAKRQRRKPAPFEPEGKKVPGSKSKKLVEGKQVAQPKSKRTKKCDNTDELLEKEDQRAKEDALIREYFNMTCEICSYEFESFLDARHHYRRVHDKAGYLPCCNKRLFNRSSVLDHIKVHLDPDTFR